VSGTTIDGFESFPSRLVGELDERLSLAARALHYFNPFLDDCLRGILPHDLVLLGAPSGMGKTDLALSIATSNAQQEHRVSYFALEAEPRELERRTKFAILSSMLYRAQHSDRQRFNYADWLLGKCESICGHLNAKADQHVLSVLSGLRTFYRGAKFDAADLQRMILEIHERTDLIMVDHLHYVDAVDEDTNEAKSLGDTVKTIRDVSLRIGKPVFLVAHLRKRDQRAKQIVATQDDFHGSSNVVKIATQVIALEHAPGIDPPKWYLAPTFISVLKDRRAGAPRLVALTYYDKRTRSYVDYYTIGKVKSGEWEALSRVSGDVPDWAKHHRDMEVA
jgi:hypothetical protein